MKKFISALVVVFICILCMPILYACGGTGATELKSIRFTKSVYEAEINQEFELTYKVNPSTAQNYSVTFDFVPYDSKGKIIESSLQAYSFVDGKFTILDSNCYTISATIRYGSNEEDSDICTIKRKIYPTSMYFETATDIINSGSTYNLNLMAEVDGKTISIDRSMYNIELKSSAPNVISVSENGLVAVSSGLSGSATIEARIIKLSGGYYGIDLDNLTGMVARITLTVVQNVDYAVVALEGQDEFITTSTTYGQTTNNTYTTTSSQLKLKVLLYSSNNICVDNSSVTIDILSDSSIAQVSKNNDGSYFMVDGQYVIILKSKGTACIEITSNAVDNSGNPVKFIFYLTKEEADVV